MSLTIHIPMWLLWGVGGVIALVILALAAVGLLVLHDIQRSSWPV